MDKKRIIIISAICSILVIAGVIIAILTSNLLNSNNKNVNFDDTSDTQVTDIYNVTRPKIESPASIVATIYNTYNDNSFSDISKFITYGFNSVIYCIDSETDKELVSQLISQARENNIYTGIRIDGNQVGSNIEFFKKNNVDYVVISSLDESSEQFSLRYTELFTSFRSIDSAAFIGFEVNNPSVITDNLKTIISNKSIDFVMLTQQNLNDNNFTAAQTLWDEAPVNIWMSHSLKGLSSFSSDDSLSFIDVINASSSMSQCKALVFNDYSDIKNASGPAAETVKEYILTKETYLIDKDFSISNYSNTTISTDSSTINFKGSSSPLYEVKCNNQVINTADNGDFSVDCILKPGSNKVIFEHKGKTYTYNVTYSIKILKEVSPERSVTIPGGIQVEVTAIAHKNADVKVSFNGSVYDMTELKGENGENDVDLGTDFSMYSANIKTPGSKTTAQNLGSFTVTAKYSGVTESMKGADITVSAKAASSPSDANVTTTTTQAASDTTITSVSTVSLRETKSTKGSTNRNTTSEALTSSQGNQADGSSQNSVYTTDMEKYDYTKNYGLGTAQVCVIIDDYVETYAGNNTSSKSVPDCSPLLKGTVDYITGSGVCSDNSDNITYYYLESGVKVPLFREENTTSGSNTKITHLKVVDGYRMPSNKIHIISCESVNGDTVIRLSMNRLVAFNAKITGQSYTSYNGRYVAVSGLDCKGLQFDFSDTSNIDGSLSFMNSVINSGRYSVSNNTATLSFSLAQTGRFYGYSYSWSNGVLTITIKNKPSSLAGYTIMLDPGHGGYDSGAVCAVNSAAWSEKKINLSIANKIKELLETEGATVIMTRSEDKMLSLSTRNEMVRNKQPDLFISIHCDGSTSSESYGTSAYYYRAYSQPLAKYIHQAVVSAYKNNVYSGKLKDGIDRGTGYYAYKVARIEDCPAVLIEYGFVTNTEECEALQNASNREALAKATVSGIRNYIANS